MTLRLRRDVRLAPLTADHASNMYSWMSDPVIRYSVGLRSEPSLDRTLDWIAKANRAPDILARAILLHDNHVGNVILDQYDKYLNKVRISVYIGATKLHGAGLGRTGCYLILAEGFEKLDLAKVWTTIHYRNTASINSFLSLGFSLEGILRKEFIYQSQAENAFLMGLLQEDFSNLTVEWSTD